MTSIVKMQRQQEGEKKFISLVLPSKVIDQIDQSKGDVTRSLFVRRAIYSALKEQHTTERDEK